MLSCVAPLVLSLLLPSAAHAQYRCVENGKIQYGDKPCDGIEKSVAQPIGNAPKVIGDTGNVNYQTPYGDWRGQVQYQASLNGQPIADAHSVVPAVISIDTQGKIIGSSPENGCRYKGQAIPGFTPQMLSLDITLSGCRFPTFNRRIAGTLTLNPTQRHAFLLLHVVPLDFLRPGQQYEIKGTLRR